MAARSPGQAASVEAAAAQEGIGAGQDVAGRLASARLAVADTASRTGESGTEVSAAGMMVQGASALGDTAVMAAW